jgi:hypothetical protein
MASAELRVVSSTVDGIAVDAAFADDAIFNVPPGRKILLLKKPGFTTHEITGPYRGALAGYKTACGWWSRLRGKCRTEADNSPGTVVGGTRGFSTPSR